MTKSIGIIGISGRMGSILSSTISQNDKYTLGPGFSRDTNTKLEDVFVKNDYVVDFSSSSLVKDTLQAALMRPKPLIICATGWPKEEYTAEFITPLAKKVPVVIAPNTSMGACLQYYMARQLAKILDGDYDIDITDRHHKHKVDVPSGTAKLLLEGIISTKKNEHGLQYVSDALKHGPRPEKFICLEVARRGNLPGEHEVTFTSDDESISIKHVAFNRNLFAKGAVKILNWLEKTNPKPGVYSMMDALQLM